MYVLDLSNVEFNLTGTGVEDPMAHPAQAALSLQQEPLPLEQQHLLQPPNQQQEPNANELDNILEEILAGHGVDDPNALPS